MMEYLAWTVAGTLYGFLIGLIPVAGATTALITVYAFLDVFRADPYTLVVFTTAIVVSSTIGDSFSSIMLNIPGAGGSAATMVDGFPLARQGQGARALSAAVTTSGINGLIWGIAVFLFLPYYAKAVLSFGLPEQLSFMVLAFATIVFVNSHYWFRGMLSLALGIFMGLIGQDPITGEQRWTGGWDYLGAGMQIAPILAGVLALPELIELYRKGVETVKFRITNYDQQIKQGIKDSITHLRDGLRGGIIGGLIGMIPGIGGSVADWVAYGQTVAANKQEKVPFGEGNIKGVIGCEGANNAQKATGYVPTVLFGIPAAPFEAVIMSLFVLVGLEMGTPTLLKDSMFFNSLTYSYIGSLILTMALSYFCIRYAARLFDIKLQYWYWPLIALIIWSCVQYTGYWEDYAVLAICTLLGLALKTFKFSRAAFIIGFVLSDRLEKIAYQYSMLFDWNDLFMRPISLTLISAAIIAIIYGLFFNKTRISYT